MTQKYKVIPVTQDEDGSRLDRVIHKKHPYLTQGIIEKSLRKKLILVNQQKSLAKYRLNIGDYLQISSNLIQENYSDYKQNKQISPEQIKIITDNIIYRDADLIAINKPAGLAVQGGSKIKTSIDDIIPKMLEASDTWCSGDPVHKLVHRLDKETSGVLLIALNNRTAKELAYAFKHHLIEKKYLAILTGHLKVNNGQVSSTIKKEFDKTPEAENAITNYKVLAKKSQASYVEFRPITGKTHQLRLHALELGYPILGDKKYDPNLKESNTTKLHLHAAEISIPHKGNILKLNAELPSYFKKSLKEIFLI